MTEPGIVNDVSPLQAAKASCPISVTEFGIVIDVRPKQPENAQFAIEVTVFGMFTSPFLPAGQVISLLLSFE